MLKKLTLSLVVCVALFAEENVKTLEDMTVTADKRETKLFETDATIDVMTETDIKDFGINNTFDIENLTSNMFLQITAPYSPNAFGSIRGISSTEGYNPAFGIYVNDIYQQQINFGLMDIERIEILKGPQGTLYGKNAEAGVINIVTKKPNPKKIEGKVKLEVGQENTRGITGNINVPLTDKSAVKVSLGRHEDDGYFKNEFNGDDTQKQKNTDARVEFLTKPTDRLEAYLVYGYQDYKTDGLANLAEFSDDMTKVNVNYMGYSNYKTHQASLNLTYDMDFAKLQSITSLSYYKGKLSNDLDISTTHNSQLLHILFPL